MQVTGPVARVLPALLVLTSAACGGGDARAPSEANFKPAIDAHLAANPKCVGEPAWMLPAELPNPEGADPGYQAIIERLRTVVRLGLVSATPKEGRTAYALTEAGRRVYRTFPAGRWDPRRPVGAFCYGVAKASGVVRWTEPGNALGEVTTQVTYLGQLGTVDAWAEDAEIRRQFPYVEQELATRTAPAEARVTLVLMSDGWRARGR